MEVKQIESYKGHKMVQLGTTKISLAKALKCVECADQLKAIAEKMDKNPFKD